MKNGTTKLSQVTGLLFAVVLFLFSIGNSWTEPNANTISSDNQFSWSNGTSNRIAPQENLDDMSPCVVHIQRLEVAINFFNPDIPFVAYKTCQALFVNGHIRNAFYALPSIHAP